MYRREMLALAGVVTAGCTSQQVQRSTQTGTQVATQTREQSTTPTETETDTSTETVTSTPTPVSAASEISVVVESLNQVYRELNSHLDEFSAEKPDYQRLRTELQAAADALEEATAGDRDERTRLDSLRTTHAVFEAFVTALSWLRDVYAVHARINVDYRRSDSTTETGEQLGKLRSYQQNMANAASGAVDEFESLDGFDRGLIPEYDSFGTHIHALEQLADALSPFEDGLSASLVARRLWTLATDEFDGGDYEAAKEAFAEVQTEFEAARESLQDAAPGINGALGSYHDTYLCEAAAGRRASVSYQSACRAYLFNNPESGKENAKEAEAEYAACEREED